MIEGIISPRLISLKAVKRLILNYMSLAAYLFQMNASWRDGIASKSFQSISIFYVSFHFLLPASSFYISFLPSNERNKQEGKRIAWKYRKTETRHGIHFLFLLFQSDYGEERHKNYIILKQSNYFISNHSIYYIREFLTASKMR